MINWLIPEIIPVVILPIDQNIAEDAVGSGDTLHVRCTIISEDIITDAERSTTYDFWTPDDVIRHGTDGTNPRDVNTVIGSTRLALPVRIGGSTTGSQIRTWSQYIISPRGFIDP